MPSLPYTLSSALGVAHLTIGVLSLAVPVWTAINVFGLSPGQPVLWQLELPDRATLF